MYYKGIIFDLDNTLYDYSACHEAALRTCIGHLCGITNMIADTVVLEYNKISANLKHELPGVASSHNKAIYFKQILENLGLPYRHFATIHDLYWTTFYAELRPFDGVCEFMEWHRATMGTKLAILTDYETEYQLVKLEKLGLLDLVDHIVTSEEVGAEKPSRRAFLAILDRMGLAAKDVCMIGDSYTKDICGAVAAGIALQLWFCPGDGGSGAANRIPYSTDSYMVLRFKDMVFSITGRTRFSPPASHKRTLGYCVFIPVNTQLANR